eukprot:sb/3472695/
MRGIYILLALAGIVITVISCLVLKRTTGLSEGREKVKRSLQTITIMLSFSTVVLTYVTITLIYNIINSIGKPLPSLNNLTSSELVIQVFTYIGFPFGLLTLSLVNPIILLLRSGEIRSWVRDVCNGGRWATRSGVSQGPQQSTGDVSINRVGNKSIRSESAV